jgi:hypothetical protein
LTRILPTVSILLLAMLPRGAAQTQTPTPQETKEANLKAYVELLRKDVKKDKVAILTELMQLDPDQAGKFWPVYREFDNALTKLADERIALIRMYAENQTSLTDQKASQISMGMLDLEGRRNQLKKDYFQRMSQALSGKLAARFLQIENQLERVVDLQIAASLPVVE